MTGYIEGMRNLVGTRPLMQVGASIVVMNDRREVLMLRRTDNDCWCFPGGSVELGEPVEDAARRELREEAGIEAGGLELLNVFSGESGYYRYPNGDEVYNVEVTYLSNGYSGEIRIDEESSDFGFFSMDALPEATSPPQIPVIEYLKTKLSV